MRWPWVSRTAFDIVTAQCLGLLEEKKTLVLKLEHMERSLLKTADSSAAHDYIRRVEPRAPGLLDPEPMEPPLGASWEKTAQYYLDHADWEERHKKKNGVTQ